MYICNHTWTSELSKIHESLKVEIILSQHVRYQLVQYLILSFKEEEPRYLVKKSYLVMTLSGDEIVPLSFGTKITMMYS